MGGVPKITATLALDQHGVEALLGGREAVIVVGEIDEREKRV